MSNFLICEYGYKVLYYMTNYGKGKRPSDEKHKNSSISA